MAKNVTTVFVLTNNGMIHRGDGLSEVNRFGKTWIRVMGPSHAEDVLLNPSYITEVREHETYVGDEASVLVD